MGGRYDKHDTARLRSIKDIALRGLPFGELVCEDDLRMLRLALQNELSGHDKVAMDAWRRRSMGVILARSGQAKTSPRRSRCRSSRGLRGTPRTSWRRLRHGAASKKYVLHFGKYKGFRLEQLVMASHSRSKKMEDEADSD